jgi:hypothetical protein
MVTNQNWNEINSYVNTALIISVYHFLWSFEDSWEMKNLEREFCQVYTGRTVFDR